MSLPSFQQIITTPSLTDERWFHSVPVPNSEPSLIRRPDLNWAGDDYCYSYQRLIGYA